MTKQQIRETINEDWIEELKGLSSEEAVAYLTRECPDGYFLDVAYDYERSYGQMSFFREETDEEEAQREEKEAERDAEYLLRKRLQREEKEHREAARKVLQVAKDRLLSKYKEEHKDNPRLEDMCNLREMIIDLESQGKSVDTLKECLELLERGK